jgi:hypothetical protein
MIDGEGVLDESQGVSGLLVSKFFKATAVSAP